MAITDIISKQVTVLKADASQFKAEMRSAGAVEQKVMKDRLDGLEKQTAALERSGQKFGLWAAAGVAAFGLISTSVKKYEENLKSLGDRGAADLKKLQDTTGALTKAQDSLQISIAKVALAAAPAAKALADMANELANIVGGVGDLLNQIPGGGMIGTGLTWSRRLANPVAMAGWGLGELRSQFGGSSGGVGRFWGNLEVSVFEAEMRAMEAERNAQAGAVLVEGSPEWNAWRLRQLQGMGRRGRPTPRRRGGGGFELAGTVIDEGAVLDYNMDTPYLIWQRDRALDQRLARGSADIGSYADLAGRQSGDLDRLMNELRIEESMKGAKELMAAAQQRESLLESVFGPVEEFQLYQTAWQGLEEVVTAGFNAWIDGSKSVGEAMKEALHGFAKQLAGEALLQALRHGAYALGSLAFGDVRAASQHGIAAAKWGAVALTAGVIGKATAPSQGAGAGSGAYAAAGIGGGIRPAGNTGGVHNTIILGDPLGYDSPRSQAQRVRRGLDLAEERTRNSRSVAYA